MAINTLTDADCRRATPNDGKLRKLFDGHGLMLAVLPSGNKVWRMAYRNDEGKLMAIYFQDEIAGFAFHLKQN
ncbi:MAG: Arm DNA-binding domain-containing protein [Oscillibacter sp.]